MKKIFLMLTISLLTPTLFAAQNLGPYQNRIQAVTSLEASGQIKEALLLSIQTSQEIGNQIGMQQTVASIHSALNEIQQEIVTEKHSINSGFSFLLGLISGEGSTSWNVTTIVTVNPEEIAGFDAKVTRDYRDLQGQLSTYVRNHEMGLLYTKAFAAKALQLALKLDFEGRKSVSEILQQVVNSAQRMTFDGVQTIERCTTTHFIDRADNMEASFGGLFLSGHFSQKHETLAQTTKNCQSSSRIARASETDIFSGKLSMVDGLIQNYKKALGLKDLQDAQPEYYPTWGLPAYH